MCVRFACVLGGMCALAASAAASVTFDNITVGGSLIADPNAVTVSTTDVAIDIFPNAFLATSGSANLSVAFDVTAEDQFEINTVLATFLGATLGEGSLELTQTITDLAAPNNVLASYSALVPADDSLPLTAPIQLLDAAPAIRVEIVVEFVTVGDGGQSGFGFAGISLIEQTFGSVLIPEPASLTMLLLAGGLLLRRRGL